MEYHRNDYTISTDKAALDRGLIHTFLSESSYWARGRTRAVVERSIDHSLCFGVYKGAEQVGFARIVTDYTTFAWLCDLFVVESERGKGLSKWLVECVTSLPELRQIPRFLLATADAHGLYRRYGAFEALPNAERWMLRPPASERKTD